MFLINNLLSVHVSFVSAVLWTDVWSGALQTCNTAEIEAWPAEPCILLGRAGILVAPKQVLHASVKCIALILYFLSFHCSKCFPYGLNPTTCLISHRCNLWWDPPAHLTVYETVLSMKNKLQGTTIYLPLPAPVFVNARCKHLSRTPRSEWQTRKYQIKAQVLTLLPLTSEDATGNELKQFDLIHESGFARCLMWQLGSAAGFSRVSLLREHSCLSTGWLVTKGHLQCLHHQWSMLCKLSVAGTGGSVLEVAIHETL